MEATTATTSRDDHRIRAGRLEWHRVEMYVDELIEQLGNEQGGGVGSAFFRVVGSNVLNRVPSEIDETLTAHVGERCEVYLHD